MALFQNSVLNKYLKQQDSSVVHKAYNKFKKYFHNPTIQQNIRERKEEQFQEGFLIELFVNVLDYTLAPNPKYNLTTELKNEKGAKKADGAILKDGNALGVIELKSTKTKDLEKVRQQAFDYKANQTGCVYVITSNFEKVRFYINNAVDFEEFDLFTLTQERFELLYLCLAKENLLSNIPLKIKEASIQEESTITKKFYNDYSLFKRELFRDLVKLNSENEVFRMELNKVDSERANKNIKLQLFKKSQKLIDRFLFIFFAEDRGLLPPNSTLKILEQWDTLKELDEVVPLYHRFKKYFKYLDEGRKGTNKSAEIFAYNGGLFKPDIVLDSLFISDQLLYKHTKDLSNYDFDSQVDVNILGHIFENSLNEIENVNAEIEGTEFDKQKTKRKKDGVFYTPKYITKYIVDNTIGKLCSEKKTKLNIIEGEYHPKRQKETKKKLLAALQAYRDWLLQITILDPACGSGAFLNQALDFLIKEHGYIDELQTKLLGGGFVFPNIENTVLENNIYGVDLNEESVEIAKLSLWLRTAQPRRKLNNLSSNIKCGNSLIDSKAVAGDKAFKWEKEFPQVFKEKKKRPHHITWVTHNSRTSQRMIDHKVKKGDTLWIDNEWELNITKTIAEIIKQDDLNVLAYNICGDHVHMLIVCEDEDVSNIVRKLKGKSSQRLKEYLQIPKEEQFTLWAQKYSNTYIDTEEKLRNTISYIQTNRVKHELQNNKGLQPLVNEMCCSYEHAFRTEQKGGFDVVIGNPPYGAKLDEVTKYHLIDNYECFKGNFDIYSAFIQLAFVVCKRNGYWGFINPVSWQSGEQYLGVRKYLVENGKLEIGIKLPYNVFSDAYVDTGIYIYKNVSSENYTSLVYEFPVKFKKLNDLSTDTHLKCLKNSAWLKLDSLKIVLNPSFYSIAPKVRKNTILMSEVTESIRGILANKEDIKEDITEDMKSYFIGGLYRYKYSSEFCGVNYGEHLIEKPKKYSFFQGERILIRRLINRQFRLMAAYTDKEFVNKKDLYNLKSIDPNFALKYLLAIINSRLVSYLKTKGSTTATKDDFGQLTLSDIRQIPIKQTTIDVQKTFEKKVDLITLNNSTLSEILIRFTNYLQSQFSIEKLSRKLQNWHELAFVDFIKELNKAIKKTSGEKLSKMDEMEWMEVFETRKAEAQALKSEIDKTDKEIDAMVYALYGLSEEEIAIVEGSS
jgi:REP element-mobilizing transposase RayT